MTNSRIDILWQADWDLWLGLCALAALVLLSYALVRQLWRTLTGWVALGLIAIGVGGTLLVLVLPPLHNRFVGFFWTFCLLALLSAAFYLNLLAQLGGRVLVLLTMRLVALVMCVPMLFGPTLQYISRPKPEKPLLFLIDTSGSMSFPDVQNGPTRIQSVWQTLRPQLDRLNDHFIPMYYAFATDLQEVKKPQDFAKITADGKATDIAGAVRKATYKTNLSGASIVLISDGVDNTSPDVTALVTQYGWPIHTLRVGSEQAEPATLANVAVDNVETADDFVVGHETKIKITVKSTALRNRVVVVHMSELDDNGKPTGDIKNANLVLDSIPQGQTVELPYKPKSIGVHRLAAWIDPIPGERSLADNRQEFQGLALDPRIKVLYIEGRARPEYRELSRALGGRDQNIELASLLRVQGDRFFASGQVDGNKFEQLPQSPEEWKKFDVVILGDMPASFLPKIQQAHIERFVNAGGSLLMLGGAESFGPGGYKDSPIELALPVFVGEVTSLQEKTQFVPRLTLEGSTHPAMEGLQEWFGVDKTAGAKALPPLRGNVVVDKPKKGAQVLLTHIDRPGPDGQPQIVLALQRYGEGRSAAFTGDTTWLWYLPLRGMGQDSPYNKFWGQLIRWLAGEEVRNRQHGAGVEGLLNKSLYQLGESVRVRAMVRDQRGDATQFAQVSLKLSKPGEKDKQFPLSPVESRHGLYDVTIPPHELDKGDYTIELTATKDGKPLGKQSLKFTIIPPADEMLKIAANPELLMKISNATQGKYHELAQLPQLLEELIKADKAATTARQETICLANTARAATVLLTGRNPTWDTKWDLPMQGALVLALLAAEWIVRRRWQLP